MTVERKVTGSEVWRWGSECFESPRQRRYQSLSSGRTESFVVTLSLVSSRGSRSPTVKAKGCGVDYDSRCMAGLMRQVSLRHCRYDSLSTFLLRSVCRVVKVEGGRVFGFRDRVFGFSGPKECCTGLRVCRRDGRGFQSMGIDGVPDGCGCADVRCTVATVSVWVLRIKGTGDGLKGIADS